MDLKRSCGIVMPLSALPSPYGIGAMGKAAYDFIDFLASAGQSWWQMLPVGPTSYGDSPYQSFSTFAGNPYFIDLDLLCADGLLKKSEVGRTKWGDDAGKVDYETIYRKRFRLLEKAAARGWERDRTSIEAFCEANSHWLPDYALFMALKRHFGMRAWTQWPDEAIRMHQSEAIGKYRAELSGDIQLFTYIQFLFFRQWETLRAYAAEKGVGIIGDMPIYVAMDSADVWAQPRFFQLDENNVPTAVAGVPPDYFSADGQLWGNPLYDWDAMRADGYGWWIRRVDGAAKLYDVLRIDHFRGLESYWAVPSGETTARNGRWVKGPGMDLIGRLKGWFPKLQFIAEDLGFLTSEVKQLLASSGFPGMKVLEFAFDAKEPSNYLPHTYSKHCVCYTGTHDNAPLAVWLQEADSDDLALAVKYLGLNEEEGFVWGVIRGGMSSVADLFLAQMQDYLELGGESRMNTPGRPNGNWQWRLKEGQLTDALAEKIAYYARIYGRSSADVRPAQSGMETAETVV